MNYQEFDKRLITGAKIGVDMCIEYLQRWADNIDNLPSTEYNIQMSWLIRKAARDMSKIKDELK